MTRDVKGRKTLLSHVFEIINLAIKPWHSWKTSQR